MCYWVVLLIGDVILEDFPFHVHKIILPWAVPIRTWIHQRCNSRAGLVHPHVLSTANTNTSQRPRKGKTSIFDAGIICRAEPKPTCRGYSTVAWLINGLHLLLCVFRDI